METDYSKHTLSMEDKMAAGAFGHATNYGWDSPFKHWAQIWKCWGSSWLHNIALSLMMCCYLFLLNLWFCLFVCLFVCLFYSLDLDIWDTEDPIPREELLKRVAGIDGLYCLLTEKIDSQLLDTAGEAVTCLWKIYQQFISSTVHHCFFKSFNWITNK